MLTELFLELGISILFIIIGVLIKQSLIIVNYSLRKRWWVFVVIGGLGILLRVIKLI